MAPLHPGEASEDLEERSASLPDLPARNERREEVGSHGGERRRRRETDAEMVPLFIYDSPRGRLTLAAVERHIGNRILMGMQLPSEQGKLTQPGSFLPPGHSEIP